MRFSSKAVLGLDIFLIDGRVAGREAMQITLDYAEHHLEVQNSVPFIKVWLGRNKVFNQVVEGSENDVLPV